MFDVGFWELAVIAVIALLVVGPDRLPGLARTVGLWVGKARGIMLTLRDELEREIELDEVRKVRNETKSDLKEAEQEVRESIAPVSGPPRASPSPFKTQKPGAEESADEAGAAETDAAGQAQNEEQGRTGEADAAQSAADGAGPGQETSTSQFEGTETSNHTEVPSQAASGTEAEITKNTHRES